MQSVFRSISLQRFRMRMTLFSRKTLTCATIWKKKCRMRAATLTRITPVTLNEQQFRMKVMGIYQNALPMSMRPAS